MIMTSAEIRAKGLDTTAEADEINVLFYVFSPGSTVCQQGVICPCSTVDVTHIQPGAHHPHNTPPGQRRRRWGKMDNGPFRVIPTIINVFIQCKKSAMLSLDNKFCPTCFIALWCFSPEVIGTLVVLSPETQTRAQTQMRTQAPRQDGDTDVHRWPRRRVHAGYVQCGPVLVTRAWPVDAGAQQRHSPSLLLRSTRAWPVTSAAQVPVELQTIPGTASRDETWLVEAVPAGGVQVMADTKPQPPPLARPPDTLMHPPAPS